MLCSVAERYNYIINNVVIKLAFIHTTETMPLLSLSPFAVNCASGNLGDPCVTGSHQEPGNSSIEPLGWESCTQGLNMINVMDEYGIHMYIHICTCTCTHTRMHAHTQTHTHTHAHTHKIHLLHIF